MPKSNRADYTIFAIIVAMRSADLLIAGRRRAGLTQDQLARRLGCPQSTIARWEKGRQRPSLETLIEVLHACDLELMVGLANFDDSYDSLIAGQLRLEPADRVARLSRRMGKGFDALGVLREVAVAGEVVLVGDVAGALHGWPLMLGRRTVEVVPADTAIDAVQALAERLGGRLQDTGDDGGSRWLLPGGGMLSLTPVPRGTRGYRDLARDGQLIEIGSGVSVRVASLIDLIRIAEAAGESSSRAVLPALWSTLQMRQAKDQQARAA